MKAGKTILRKSLMTALGAVLVFAFSPCAFADFKTMIASRPNEITVIVPTADDNADNG